MVNRELLKNIDWYLVGMLIWNSLLGILFIYSSSHYLPGNSYVKQILWVIVGLAALFLLLSVDYKVLVTYSFSFYLSATAVLLGMLFLSRLIAGTKSWIKLPFFQAQPSELTKVILILLLARFFSEYKSTSLTWNASIWSSAAVAVPFVLTGLQPDLSTAACFLPPLLGAWLLAGLKRKTFVWILTAMVLVGAAGWHFYLKDYQKKRLTTVVFPSQDPRGSGYHILQSKIAIGSGGFLGKGFKKGSQSQLNFLPARHTDFVFSVIGEETGFAGVCLVLFSYFLFLSRLFRSVGQSSDRTGIYIIFMVAVLLSFQVLINMAMVIGLVPVVGIPLPFLSYGGSSLLANYLAVGLVINVKMRRFANV